VTVPWGSELVIAAVTAWPDRLVAGGAVHVITGGWSVTVMLGVELADRPLLSCTVTVIVNVAEGVPFAKEYAWLSVDGGPDMVLVVPTPQFTVVVTTVPSGSDAVIVTITVCPGEGFVEDSAVATTGGRSVIVTDSVETAVEPLLSVTFSFTV